MNITLQITGATDIEEKLTRLGSRLYMLDKSMRQIGEYLARYFSNEAFASQGQVFSQTWPRLNPKYSIWKAKHFPGRPPEVLSGEMQRSFTFEAGSTSVRVGNTQDYFAYQQEGTSRGLPPRPMIGINASNKRMIGEIISAEVKAMLASV